MMVKLTHETMMEILTFAAGGGEVVCHPQGWGFISHSRMTISNDIAVALTKGGVMMGTATLTLTPKGRGFVERRKARCR